MSYAPSEPHGKVRDGGRADNRESHFTPRLAHGLTSADLWSMASETGLKVAIVHDWLVTRGGAELVLDELLATFPGADVFTLVDQRADRGGGETRMPVTTSWLQHVPGIARTYRSWLPLMPLALRSLNVADYDVVISNSHAVAKGIRTHRNQLHVCYCLSPMRYAWDLKGQYLRESGLDRGVKGAAASAMLERMRRWDLANTRGVDAFATLSHYIAERIQRAYARNAEVIYPPVDTDFFTPAGDRGDFYVTASRFVPYKRIDMIAAAFRRLADRRLIVIGDGPDWAKVRAAAGPNVELAGRLPRSEVRDYLRRARAFVFAAEEDFGIAPVEAQACGTPVIAFGRGGATETVRGLDAPAPTGVFYEEQSADALAAAVQKFERLPQPIDAAACRDNSLRFGAALFRSNIRGFVERSIKATATACILLASAVGVRTAEAHVSHVPAASPEYDWLYRQRVAGMAPDFSYEMLPLTRGTVESLLEAVARHRDALSPIDRAQLASFMREFSVDSMRVAQHDTYLQGWDSTIVSSVKRKFRLLASDREPYLYAHADSNVNGAVYFRWADGAYSSTELGKNTFEKFGWARIDAFGTLYDHFGFDTYGLNAYSTGAGESVRLNPQWAAAITGGPAANSVLYSQAYVSWRYKQLGIDIGNGAPRLGLGGDQAVIIRSQAPNFPWVRLVFDSKLVQFEQYYASLQGYARDTLIGNAPGIATQAVPERWLMMHRLQIRPSDKIQLGFTETMTYSNRPFDITFLDPVYPLLLAKSDGGNNGNGVIVDLDAVYRPFKRVELYATLGIDDLACFADIFTPTGHRCNDDRTTKLLYLAGGTIALPHGTDLQAEYLRVDPYYGLHMQPLNGMQQDGYSLLTDVGPNADQFWFSARQWITTRSWIRATAALSRHGLNFVDSTGAITTDVGGSINSVFGSGPVIFLAGDVQKMLTLALSAHFEPSRGIGLDISYQDRHVMQGTQIPGQHLFIVQGNFAFYPLSFLLKAVGLAP